MFIVCVVLATIFGVWFFSKQQPPFVTPIAIKELVSLLPTPWIPKEVSLDSIFTENHAVLETVPLDKKWTLIATGDVIPARSVNFNTVKKDDFLWAWKHIIPILVSGDVTLINLESPLITQCPSTVEGMVFCGDQRHILGLKAAHITIANFANNHMGNYGQEGIEETKKLLEKNAIQISGLGEGTTIDIKGIRVRFLGFDDIGPNVFPIAAANIEEMKKQIVETKQNADVVVVSMNWGVEYTDKPNSRQVELAHSAIDFGADLIIGNHPHWIQPVELYKGKMIMYAHGNTIFDQMWSEKTKEGVIGKYTFYGKDLVDVEFIPTYIKEYGQPMLVEGDKKKEILDTLFLISREIL
jgi:poly-gamma-glutamate synthesis protein (capsule biosynthesis protein)